MDNLHSDHYIEDITKIRNSLDKAYSYFQAYSKESNDKLVKQISYDLLCHRIMETGLYLSRRIGSDYFKNLETIITSLKIALWNHKTEGLSQKQIKALGVILNWIRQEVPLSEYKSKTFTRKLREAKFNYNPKKNVDILIEINQVYNLY